jgi:hypothetical protein
MLALVVRFIRVLGQPGHKYDQVPASWVTAFRFNRPGLSHLLPGPSHPLMLFSCISFSSHVAKMKYAWRVHVFKGHF